MTTIDMDPRLRARRVEVLRVRGRRRLRLLAVASATVATVLSVWWVVERSPVFDVEVVVVDGARRTAPETVIAASGVSIGEPLVEVDTSTAQRAIAALPWVQHVTSDRSLGGEVKFVLTERVAVAAVAAPHGWLIVDREGRVLEVVSALPRDLVVLDGSRWRAVPGGWISEAALPALDVASLLPVGLRPKVASVDVSADGVELILFGGGRVLLGDQSELESKFLSALTLLVRIDVACLDHIDVRAPTVPVLTRLAECS